MAEDKEYKFKGKVLSELQALSIEEFSELLPSRLRRKIKRGFTEQEQIFLANLRSGKNNLKTHCRDLVILPEMVGKKIQVYNGKEFVALNINEEMVGYRLGEFSHTRKMGVVHAGGGAKKTDVRK